MIMIDIHGNLYGNAATNYVLFMQDLKFNMMMMMMISYTILSIMVRTPVFFVTAGKSGHAQCYSV